MLNGHYEICYGQDDRRGYREEILKLINSTLIEAHRDEAGRVNSGRIGDSTGEVSPRSSVPDEPSQTCQTGEQVRDRPLYVRDRKAIRRDTDRCSVPSHQGCQGTAARTLPCESMVGDRPRSRSSHSDKGAVVAAYLGFVQLLRQVHARWTASSAKIPPLHGGAAIMAE